MVPIRPIRLIFLEEKVTLHFVEHSCRIEHFCAAQMQMKTEKSDSTRKSENKLGFENGSSN